MLVRNLLVDTHTHLPPAATLAGLSDADAARRVGGVPHSIAEIVAHMAFWQDWFRRRCEGGTDPAAATAALGWPSVAEDAWPEVRDGFVAGLEQLARVVEQLDPDLPIAPGVRGADARRLHGARRLGARRPAQRPSPGPGGDPAAVPGAVAPARWELHVVNADALPAGSG